MEKFRVLIADDLSPRAVEILSKEPKIAVDVKVGMKPEELVKVVGQYDAVLVRSATKITAEILEAAQKLKLVGRAGIGVDNIDVKAASRRGVIVENTPSGNATTAAEHAICLLAALARFIPQATASMKNGKWEKKKFQGWELSDKTIGVVGLGNIGRIVADRARGLRMNVIAYDPFLGHEAAERLGVELVSLDDLYARADFITIHTPMTAETKGLVGPAAFAKMKKGVLLVNAARGGIVDEAALLAALNSGKVAGAALDVFIKEPPDPADPLVTHERVICTPHLGASTEEAQEKVAVEVAEQVVAFVQRGEVKNAVNIAPVRAEALPKVQPWLDLANRLGSLAGQLMPRGTGAPGIDEVEVTVVGEVADLGAVPVTRAAVAGLLRSFLALPVNEVNAPIIAEERGVRIIEVKKHKGETFAAAVHIRVKGAAGSRVVSGTIFHVGDRNEQRIVRIDDFVLDAAPEGRIVIIRNLDRPGVIGMLGTLLGQRGINVSGLYVGRATTKASEGPTPAIMLWQVDSEVPQAVLDEVRKLPNVESVQQVNL